MCTGIRFTNNEGNMYAGRNLDWECGYGEKVTVTPRDYVRRMRSNNTQRGLRPLAPASSLKICRSISTVVMKKGSISLA